MKEKPLGALHWEDIDAQGAEAGSIENARDWTMTNVRFATDDGKPVSLARCDHVDAPIVTRGVPAPTIPCSFHATNTHHPASSAPCSGGPGPARRRLFSRQLRRRSRRQD